MAGHSPEGWASARVEELFDWWGGMTPSTSIDAYWGGTTPWVSSKDLKRHGVNADTQMITHRALRETRLRTCRPGTLLTVVRSGVLAHTLPVAVTDREVVINQDLKAFDSGDDGVNRWLATYLRAHAREILEENRKDGTTVQSIRVEQLVKREIPVPPLAEQRRIVEKVEALLARVGAARERLERVPRLLKRFRQAVLAAACEGRLTEGWRAATGAPDVPDNARLLDEDPPVLPRGWRWLPFEELTQEVRNGVSPRPEMEPPGVPLLRISAVRAGAVDLEDCRFLPDGKQFIDRYALRNDDLLFTRYNGSLDLLGVCGLVRGVGRSPILYPDKLIRVRLNALALPGFIELFFSGPAARSRLTAEAKSSAGQQGISGTDLKRQPVAVPPVEEQREMVRGVQALFALADTIERRVITALARAEKVPQAILSRAFAGELVPTEAELARVERRNYETADELVVRLRRKREGTGEETGRRVRRRKPRI